MLTKQHHQVKLATNPPVKNQTLANKTPFFTKHYISVRWNKNYPDKSSAHQKFRRIIKPTKLSLAHKKRLSNFINVFIPLLLICTFWWFCENLSLFLYFLSIHCNRNCPFIKISVVWFILHVNYITIVKCYVMLAISMRWFVIMSEDVWTG